MSDRQQDIAVTQPAPHELKVECIEPQSFVPERHFYPRVINAQIHALVRYFLSLRPDRIVQRYVHLHPNVDAGVLREILAYQPKILRWAGCDLMHVTTALGQRKMVIIETNSCPSGQKSTPLYEEHEEHGGYLPLVQNLFGKSKAKKRTSGQETAVLYDKNRIESSGYAATLADYLERPVFLVPCLDQDEDPPYRFENGVLSIRSVNNQWRPVEQAFRYVTQRPWSRIPLHTKTRIFNPVLGCLAGGRNKLVAAKAYDFMNADLADKGLTIETPLTYWDVAKEEIPLWVERLGGLAVVKVPYGNAGQGVYTLTNEIELKAFMEIEFEYDRFIVQSLIGDYGWSQAHPEERLYHVGTVPNKKGAIHVFDLRMMVCASDRGLRPLALYARKAEEPLSKERPDGQTSWDQLGTNLSRKRSDGGWNSETERLILTDRRDFNTLGLGLDDLIDAYVQTVLATVAIDKMGQRLLNQKGKFRRRLFASLNEDPGLLNEILV